MHTRNWNIAVIILNRYVLFRYIINPEIFQSRDYFEEKAFITNPWPCFFLIIIIPLLKFRYFYCIKILFLKIDDAFRVLNVLLWALCKRLLLQYLNHVCLRQEEKTIYYFL